MKNLNRSARVLNTLLNVLFWLQIARGVFAAAVHIRSICQLLSGAAAVPGTTGVTIDWLTIKAAQGFSLDAAMYLKLIHLVFSVAITILACLGVRALKRVLLPIENGQPFRSGISADIRSLGRCALRLGIVENLAMLATVSVMERYAILDTLLQSDAVTKITIDPVFRPAWFIVTAVLSILAMVFRQGEQLQTLADETL